MYEYNAYVVRVIDGDTIKVDVDLGFNVRRIENVRVIHKGGGFFDAPESRQYPGVSDAEKAHGIAATKYAQEILPPGMKVFIETQRDKKGKYGRYLASIAIPMIGDYADHMEGKGFIKSN